MPSQTPPNEYLGGGCDFALLSAIPTKEPAPAEFAAPTRRAFGRGGGNAWLLLGANSEIIQPPELNRRGRSLLAVDVVQNHSQHRIKVGGVFGSAEGEAKVDKAVDRAADYLR